MGQAMTEHKFSDRMVIFDIVKYVLALMVVAIHSSLYPMILYPWLRLAVPLFFIISSYFFFANLQKLQTREEKNLRWRKYIKRNATLYLFWFIVLLPCTLYVRHYFDEGVLRGCLNFVKSFLFGSTFPASWYIQASIVALSIVFYASKKIDHISLLIIGLFLYVFAVLRSSYWNVIESVPVFRVVYFGYELFFSSPIFNVPSAFIWIVIGKCFAENKIQLRRMVAFVGMLVSSVCLYVEWYLVRLLTASYNNDCYFFLIPTALFIFALICKIDLSKNELTTFLGKSSTIIYTTHIPVISVLRFLLARFLNMYNSLILYVAVVVFCTAGSYLVFAIEKNKCFKWLKYSH